MKSKWRQKWCPEITEVRIRDCLNGERGGVMLRSITSLKKTAMNLHRQFERDEVRSGESTVTYIGNNI